MFFYYTLNGILFGSYRHVFNSKQTESIGSHASNENSILTVFIN
jgi:hypothetical protein